MKKTGKRAVGSLMGLQQKNSTSKKLTTKQINNTDDNDNNDCGRRIMR
jgi:hypothetical protein